VLDRHLVHANDIDDDRNAGTADYAYYGVGLIFYDLKLSYLETGDPFFSAVSGFEGEFDDNAARNINGFRYTFAPIQNALVSAALNGSSEPITYTQTWTDLTTFTFSSGVSTLNGYEMSEMRGERSSVSVSHGSGSRDSSAYGVSGKVGISAGIVSTEVSTSASWTFVNYQDVGRDTTRESSREYTTSDMFQHIDSRILDTLVGRNMEYSIEASFPPHTQAMVRQGRSSLEMSIDYDYPVMISYKVKVVALGSQRINGISTNFMKPITTFGIDRNSTPGIEASHLEIDAAENFRVLWGFRNDPGRGNLHSTNPVSLNRIWTEMKQAFGSGVVSNFDLLFEEDGLGSTPDATLETRFIRPVTEGMTELKPMTVVHSTMTYEFESMISEFFEYQPLYALHRIETVEEIDEIVLFNGASHFIDRIELTGRNIDGVDFFGFHRDKGSWVLIDADGTLHDGSIAKIVEAVGTGRPTVIADDNAGGTVFLRYNILNNVYTHNGLNGYMAAEDVRFTAIIPVRVIADPNLTSIRDREKDSKHGIILENAIVSDIAKISIKTPESAQINLVIYDNLGNVVFETNGRNTDAFTWNLTNTAGRFVANGTYLALVEARGVSGRVYTYSSRIGVSR
jgi:hypothetical protein